MLLMLLGMYNSVIIKWRRSAMEVTATELPFIITVDGIIQQDLSLDKLKEKLSQYLISK